MKNTLKILLLFLLISCQNQKSDPKIEKGRELIKNTMKEHNMVGLAITIIKDGKTVWSEGFGYANLESETKVDPEKTMFRVGSISKPITSTAIALLYESGQVRLNDNVREYVPYFPEKQYPFTVKQLAGHMAGIRH
tara:strand:- start:49 stop:456 length:408 start_codon:yes stop_codon:yes gene_type:complete